MQGVFVVIIVRILNINTNLWYNIYRGVDDMSLSGKLQSRRLTAVKLANAVNKIEGVNVTSQAKKLSTKWVRGEISGAEMKAALVAKHKNSIIRGHHE